MSLVRPVRSATRSSTRSTGSWPRPTIGGISFRRPGAGAICRIDESGKRRRLKSAPAANFDRTEPDAPAMDLSLREIGPYAPNAQLQPTIMVKRDLKFRHFGGFHLRQ